MPLVNDAGLLNTPRFLAAMHGQSAFDLSRALTLRYGNVNLEFAHQSRAQSHHAQGNVCSQSKTRTNASRCIRLSL